MSYPIERFDDDQFNLLRFTFLSLSEKLLVDVFLNHYFLLDTSEMGLSIVSG